MGCRCLAELVIAGEGLGAFKKLFLLHSVLMEYNGLFSSLSVDSIYIKGYFFTACG